MIYNIYISSQKLKYDDGIWIYDIYEENRKRILTDSKYVSLISGEFYILPLCAALLRLYDMYKKSDSIHVMTNDQRIRNIMKLKDTEREKYPIYNKYYELKFHKMFKSIHTTSIPNCWDYITSGLFRHNRSYDHQKGIEKCLKRNISKLSVS